VVKLILGEGESLKGRLLLYDALAMRFRELKLRKNPECPVCGTNRTITKLIDYHQFCGVPRQAEETKLNSGDIEPIEVKAKLDRGDDFQLIDVREPFEAQIARIPQATLIPLGEVGKRLGEIDRTRTVVVHCKMGGRSAKAADLLRASGYTNVLNMKGGILAWSDKVDPSVPKY
jgi:adenylyltransferase/sulfurtransferase